MKGVVPPAHLRVASLGFVTHKETLDFVGRMVGVGTQHTLKPSRSEELSSPEEQERRALEVQQYLEAHTPKRPLKPARSDASDQLVAALDGQDDNNSPSEPPECHKYQELLASSTPLQTQGSGVVSEDYTESGYYENLAAIDKQHHTTGTGFISTGAPVQSFHLSTGAYESSGLRHRHPCNPAMNEWEPAPDTASPFTHKPLRSESPSESSLD